MDIPTDELIRALKAMIGLFEASGLTLRVDNGGDLDLHDEHGWLATLAQVEVE